MKRLTLELGGKSAAVVFADADLETAASASTGAVFGNSGQDCCARSRVLVQRDVYDEFVALFVAATSTFAVGDPLDATTAMGPLVSAPHLEKVRSFLDPALDIVAPVPGPSGPGHWMVPHLVLDPPRKHRILREETSGRWWRCSRSTTSRMRSRWPTTPSSVCPGRSGPATWAGRSGWPGGWSQGSAASSGWPPWTATPSSRTLHVHGRAMAGASTTRLTTSTDPLPGVYPGPGTAHGN